MGWLMRFVLHIIFRLSIYLTTNWCQWKAKQLADAGMQTKYTSALMSMFKELLWKGQCYSQNSVNIFCRLTNDNYGKYVTSTESRLLKWFFLLVYFGLLLLEIQLINRNGLKVTAAVHPNLLNCIQVVGEFGKVLGCKSNKYTGPDSSGNLL